MRIRGIAASVVAAMAGMTAMASPAAAASDATRLRYAALGDSYAAGVGSAGPYSDPTCWRSGTGYPPQVAAAVRSAGFSFAACSGAKVPDVESGQLSALSRATDLVTITIGGNDAGFSAGIAACAQGSDADCLAATERSEQFAVDTLGGLLDGLYGQIHARAPHAQVVVTGYPHFFDTGADCTTEPFDKTKRTAMNAAVDTVDAVVAGRARAAKARYVDVRAAFAGHGLCGDDPWLNGLASAAPFHPTTDGYLAGYAPLVAAAVDECRR